MFNEKKFTTYVRNHIRQRMPAGARAVFENTVPVANRPKHEKPLPRNAADGKPHAPVGTPQHTEQQEMQKRWDLINSTRAKHGFRDFSDFLAAVRTSSMPNAIGSEDPRLIANAAAPGNVGAESTGENGGFAVPPDFVPEIVRKIFADDSLLMATDLRSTRSNALSIPTDETAPWATNGGVRVYWDGEAGLKTTSKPMLKALKIKTSKLIALVPLTDELVEDSTAMVEHVSAKAPENIAFAAERAIIAGSGVGQPKGIIDSGGTVVVAAESGQAADTIVAANITKLWRALTPSARKNATWMVHPDVDLQLQTMVLSGSAGDVAASAPLYQPPSAFAPYGSILGRPVYVSEACPMLGDKGDIVVGDLSAYITVTKLLRRDVSIHLWFDFDITAYRFVLRIGGQPFANDLIPDLNGNAQRGYFAVLASRA